MKYCPKCQQEYPTTQHICLKDGELLLPREPGHDGSQPDGGERSKPASATSVRWRQVDQLLDAAIEREPEDRASFLAEACAGDEALRREVESLLAAHEQAGSFIEAPPAEVAAELVGQEHTRSMVGLTLGHYRLDSLIGAGGMGEVYRARDLRLDRDVAVKLLPEHLANDHEALRRFEREAKAVAALSHPNILSIFDFGAEHDLNYAVMELLEGEALRARLSHGALGWRGAVEIGAAIADGLAAAHAKGIIHRDLKPENIFLTTDGQVKILDFGIARVKHAVSADAETSSSRVTATTRPGTVMGTVGYMSPEQVAGETVDAPSDIFSFGCVLYEMVSGQRPFARETVRETIAAILRDEPPPLAESGKKIPEGLERVIRHCLEKRPRDRFQSARDLAFDLRSIMSGRAISAPVLAQRRMHPAIWIGAVLAIVMLGLGVWLYLGSKSEQMIDSLAVLPLANASGNAEAEYLSDGITETLINSLSQLPRLRVMARSTVFSYKGKEVDPRQAGRELNVRAVLTGRVTQRHDTLTIGTELVNVADGIQLWGEQYNRKLADILSVQTEIAWHISRKLRPSLSGEEQKRLTKSYTENTDAYQLYLKGRYYSQNLWTADGFKKGIFHINQAIALDPTYALAHAGLAATYYDASGVFLNPSEAMPEAKAAAMNALNLDETLAEAHTALAQVKAQYEWDWAEAEKHYRRAIELNPNFAPAHLYYGSYLAHQKRLEEGIEEMKQAQRLDPLTSFTNMILAFYYYVARQHDEAISRCRKIIATDPNFFPTHSLLGMAYEQKGMFTEAINEFNEAKRLDPGQPFTLGYLGHAYAMLGKRSEAQAMLDEMKQRANRTYVDPFSVAIIYVGLGEKDEAFAWLEKAFMARSESLLFYKDAPIIDGLRSDPRFADLLRRMNLPP
jgi:serine/threonine-protein kinase